MSQRDRWKKAVKNGTLKHGAMKPSERPLAEKLALLLEGTRLAEDQRGEWLRSRGLHSEHLSLYEQEIRDVMTEKEKRQREQIEHLRKENKQLGRELSRKEKALAVMAALVTLKKNWICSTGRRTRSPDSTSRDAGGPGEHRGRPPQRRPSRCGGPTGRLLETVTSRLSTGRCPPVSNSYSCAPTDKP